MSIEQNIFLSRVAEQSERFRDMINFLKPVISEKGANLTYDERNLLSVAFKNLVSQERTAIRTIAAIEQNPKYAPYIVTLKNFKKKIEEDLYMNCYEINKIIKDDILSKAEGNPEAQAFFLKMVGDYNRYVAESARGDILSMVKKDALKCYSEAS